MELNSKKLERSSKLIYYTIALILCWFLILLANKIISDLDTTTHYPEMSQFVNKNVVSKLERENQELQLSLENLNASKQTLNNTITTAQQNYLNEKQSFDNWLQTRKTLGAPNKDIEVINRAKKLDDYYKIEFEWKNQLLEKQTQIDVLEKQLQGNYTKIDKENNSAHKLFNADLKRYELKVFLIRLLFAAPILALGIFFFMRYRKHKFWPLFMGFTFFSIYVFFFGLLPYLPSYGGYVRNAVGIILSVGLGYYAIKTIKSYIDKKQAELKISTQERAKNVDTLVAEKALQNHYCPSCGKDFIIKNWEHPKKNTDTDIFKMVTDFCRHCGLELFSLCKNCNHKNFAHLPFCASCGVKTK